MNKKIFFTSILSLVLCLGLIAGGTFALFTSESETNIAITSGTVKVEATLGTPVLHSPTLIDADGKVTDNTNAASDTNFKNGGTAILSGNLLTLDKMTPGDMVSFPITLDNASNVATLYRLVIRCETPEGVSEADSQLLFSALHFVINEEDYSGVMNYESEWTPLKAGEDVADLMVEIEFPAEAGNDYQGLSTAISFAIEAVQGNTYIAPTYMDASVLWGEAAKDLTGEVKVGEINADFSAEAASFTIGDSNLIASGVTELVINGGVFNSHIKENPNPSNTDWPHVYNETNGAVIYVAAPEGSKVVFKDMTINGFYNFLPANGTWNLNLEFVNCTLNGCWVGKSNGLLDIKFMDSHFTLEGINTATAKNTNPLWIGPGVDGTSSLSLDGCLIEGNRPVKYSDDQPNQNGAVGTLSVTNTVFNLFASEYDTNANRFDRLTAVRFSKNIIIGEISGNTMVGGYAFYQTDNTPYSNADFVDTNNNKKPEDAYWTAEY